MDIRPNGPSRGSTSYARAASPRPESSPSQLPLAHFMGLRPIARELVDSFMSLPVWLNRGLFVAIGIWAFDFAYPILIPPTRFSRPLSDPSLALAMVAEYIIWTSPMVLVGVLSAVAVSQFVAKCFPRNILAKRRLPLWLALFGGVAIGLIVGFYAATRGAWLEPCC